MRVLLAVNDACKCAELHSSLVEIGFVTDIVNHNLLAATIEETVYRIVFLEADKLCEHGHDLESRIFQIKSSAHRPAVIGVVSRNQDERKKICMDAGMQDVIEIPIHLDALYETVSLVNAPHKIISPSVTEINLIENLFEINAIYY